MAQRLLFDRPGRLAYLGLLVALGCRSAPGSVVPASAAPVSREQVTAWVLETRPDSHLLHRFKWLFRDDKSSAGGRGSARIAPPDSMRFDVAGPFGAEPAAAAVVGDRPLWAQPPDAIEKMVPNYPLMWGMFGVARLPEPGAELRGLEDGSVVAWRYTEAADTVEYAAHRWQPGQDADGGAPRGQAGRPRRGHARFHRRAGQIQTHGAERSCSARSHLLLDITGRLCA